MQFKLKISIILLLQTLLGKLSMKNIEDAFHNLKKGQEHDKNLEILKSSIANPIFGFVFESSGALEKLRKFGPNLKINTLGGIRSFPDDSSKNPVVQLIIYLFPSSEGVLSHKGEAGNSFESLFVKDGHAGTQFLADVVLKLLDKNYNVPEYKDFELIQSFFNEFIFSRKDVNQDTFILDDVTIMIMTIHSFMINCYKSSDYLPGYLLRFYNNINIVKKFKYNVNLDTIIAFEKLKSEFLFGCHNQPYSFINARNSHSFIIARNFSPLEEFRRLVAKIFYNQQVLFLLDLCNCIFYDSKTQKYSTGSLDKDSKLAKFYEKKNLLSEENENDDIRAEWKDIIKNEAFLKHTVIEQSDLGFIEISPEFIQPSPQFIEDNGDFLKVDYIKTSHNFLQNNEHLIVTLVKMFKLNNNEFWKGFNKDGTIKDKMDYVFENISRISGNDLKIERLEIDPLINLTQSDIEASEKYLKEFYLTVNKNYKLLVHNESGLLSYVKFISYPTFEAEFKTLLLNKDDLPFEVVRLYISKESTVPELNTEITSPESSNDYMGFIDIIAVNKNDDFPDKVKNFFKILYFSNWNESDSTIQIILNLIHEINDKYNSDDCVVKEYFDVNKINILNSILPALLIEQSTQKKLQEREKHQELSQRK